jgi:hypothetical protein
MTFGIDFCRNGVILLCVFAFHVFWILILIFIDLDIHFRFYASHFFNQLNFIFHITLISLIR